MAVPVLFVVVFIQALALSFVLTPMTIWLAVRTNHYDHPGHRKIHSQPHPVLGGLAIFLAFNLTVLCDLLLVKSVFVTGDFLARFEVFRQLVSDLRVHLPGIGLVEKKLYAIMAGGLIVFLAGLWDDRRGLAPRWKLLFQFIASLVLIAFNIQFDLYPRYPLLNRVLTIFWVVGLSNAFNLLDNMDGLSAGVAAIVACFFAACAHQMNQTFMVIIFLTFVGSALGFLHFNRTPARTFMGDAGAMFIGYAVGAISVLMTFYDVSSRSVFALAKPMVILAVPVFDTASVLVIRLKNRKPLFLGDKNHFSHRLVALGMTRKQAVLFIYLVTFCTGLGALLIRELDVGGVLIILLQVLIIFAIIVLLEKVHTRDDAP